MGAGNMLNEEMCFFIKQGAKDIGAPSRKSKNLECFFPKIRGKAQEEERKKNLDL